MGRVAEEEMTHFSPAGPSGTADARAKLRTFSAPTRPAISRNRCLLGCVAHGNCRLERYAAQYGADPAV